MEREDIYELISHARDKKLRVALASCGYLIDEKSIAELKEAGVSSISLSIDGASAETHDTFRQTKGAFDEVIRAAKAAKEGDLSFQINTTISKLNVDEFVGISELAKRLGAACFNPFILVPTGRAKEIWEEILDPVEYENVLHELIHLKLASGIDVRVTCGPQFSRVVRQEKLDKVDNVNGCMGGNGFGFISDSGDVQTCGFLDISAGNLVEENFEFGRIWTESEFLNKVRNRQEFTGACRVCKYMDVCGGCRARAYAMNGDYLGTDPVCSIGQKWEDRR